MHKISAIVTVILLALTGCIEPQKDFAFATIPSDGLDTRTPVSLTFEIADTLSTYDVMIGFSLKRDFNHPTIDGTVALVSPSGALQSIPFSTPVDKILWKRGKVKTYRHQSIDEVEYKISDNIHLDTCGVWRCRIEITNKGKGGSDTLRGINTIGINLKRNERKR